MAERESGQSENVGVVRSRLECAPSQIETFAAVSLQVVYPIVRREELTRVGCQRKRRPVMRVSFYGLSEQVQPEEETFSLK